MNQLYVLDAATISVVFSIFFAGGLLKGAVGIGLATVCLAILTIVLDLKSAMVLLLVPVFVTNVWQASFGGHAVTILKRIWPLLLLSSVTCWFAAGIVNLVDISLLTGLLGITLTFYALSVLGGCRFEISAPRERWLGPVVGMINGTLAGLTGSFVVPAVMYLQALGLPRAAFIQAIGIHFTVSALALAVAAGGNSLLTPKLGMLSLAAVIPALVGMTIGQAVRNAMSDRLFGKVFQVSLVFVGIYVVGNSLNGVAGSVVGFPEIAVDGRIDISVDNDGG